MSRWRAASDLAFTAFDGVVSVVEEVHAAVARRPFAAVTRTGLPVSAVREVHDGVTSLVYATIHTTSAAAGALTGALVGALGAARRGRDPEPGPRWAEHVLGALGGVIGDRLDRDRNALGVRMELRHDDRGLAPERRCLADAFPDATGKIAVFVHGLCATEHAWRFYEHEPYGARLRADLGYTPLYVRYNTGLHVSENGQRLAELMDAVVGAWPVDVHEVALVGHSMGGLVARSACHYGHGADRRWVRAVRHVVCLGSPHLGAPLEKLANVGAWTLGVFRETRPFARVLNGRSVGIKDLRFGYVLDEEWRETDPDALLENARRDIPFLDSAAYHFLSATITRDPRHPIARLIGDTLVRVPSAAGRPEWRRASRWIGSTSHLRLLNDPAVYEQLREWLRQG
jgi:pimeloyl-ACP methyl ester carboxylesterase